MKNRSMDEQTRLLHVLRAWYWTGAGVFDPARADQLYPEYAGQRGTHDGRARLWLAVEKFLDAHPYERTSVSAGDKHGFARGSGDEGAYQREIERLKALLKSIRDESLTCAMVCPHSCDGCERLYSVIRRSSPQSAEHSAEQQK